MTEPSAQVPDAIVRYFLAGAGDNRAAAECFTPDGFVRRATTATS
jgi:hypothetical protein